MIGKEPTTVLMEVACTMLVTKCTTMNGCEFNLIMAAVTLACREAPARVCMDLQMALTGPASQQKPRLIEMITKYLTSDQQSQLNDPQVSNRSSELQLIFSNTIGNTANKALAKMISENVGCFVLAHGVGALTSACDELQRAPGASCSQSTGIQRVDSSNSRHRL